MKSFLIVSLLAASIVLPSASAAVAASQSNYQNSDGTHTPAIVPLLPDPNNPGKTIAPPVDPGSGNPLVTATPYQPTIVALDVATVSTGGTAVNALTSGHFTAGGFLQNPSGASVALCINQKGTASGTSSSGNTTCIAPGQSYNIVPQASGSVSVVSSDSSHPFSGYGLQ